MKKVADFINEQVKDDEKELFLERLKVHDPDASEDSFMKTWLLKGVLHDMRQS